MKIPREPLLAATIESPDDLANLQFPIWLSEKKDGIRAITDGKGVLSRHLKRIPNKWINLLLSELPPGIEGELIATDCEGNDADFEDTNSAVMSSEGEPRFQFYLFDWFQGKLFQPYLVRHRLLVKFFQGKEHDCSELELIPQHLCRDIQTIKNWYHRYTTEKGAEGVILRDPTGFYKFGRSTLKEELLIKYKPWNTDEAIVIEVIEEMENQNPQTRNKLGKATRSKHIANLQGKGTMGALLCKNQRFGEFKLGSGFDDTDKAIAWANRKTVGDWQIQFRYRGITKYGKPKHAGFIRSLN